MAIEAADVQLTKNFIYKRCKCQYNYESFSFVLLSIRNFVHVKVHKWLFLLIKIMTPVPEKIVNSNQSEPLRDPVKAVRREIESMQLFGESRELLIRHDGECYTLRRTSKGKLILTK